MAYARLEQTTAFNCEEMRLRTFVDWTNDNIQISPLLLAKDGFYVSKDKSELRCFECDLELRNIDRVYILGDLHKKLSPHCSLASGYSINNVPIALPRNYVEKPGLISTFAQNFDTTGDPGTTFDIITVFFAVPVTKTLSQMRVEMEEESKTDSLSDQIALATVSDTASRIIGDHGEAYESTERNRIPAFLVDNVTLKNYKGDMVRARYPKYAPEHERRASFANWPRSNNFNEELLCKAGFFYIGFNDSVKCYFCAGGLRNWEVNDDPWLEHCRWFYECAFVRAVKGDAFVAFIRRRHPRPPDLSSDEDAQGQDAEVVQRSLNNPIRAPEGSHNVSEEKLKKAMNSEKVSRVLQMGFRRNVVKRAIQRHMTSTGDDVNDLEELVHQVKRMEIEMQKESDREQALLMENMQRAPAAERAALSAHAQLARDNKREDSTILVASSGDEDAKEQDKLTKAQKKRAKKKQRKRNKMAAQVNDGKLIVELDRIKAAYNSKQKLTQEQEKRLGDVRLEHQRMKEARTCKVCLDREASIAFMPCGHLVCCSVCGPAMRSCPICRELIKGTVKTS